MRLNKQLLILSTLCVFGQTVHADALNIDGIAIDVTLNDAGRINPGLVWQSSRFFSSTTTFNSFFPRDRTSLIFTTDPGSTFNLQISSIKALPISLGNGLYLTFYGSVTGMWGGSTLHWEASNFEEAKTMRFRTYIYTHDAFDGITNADESANTGTLSFQLWPVIYCNDSSGCKVPNNGITINDYYLRIYAGLFGFEPSEQIISGGTITFQTGCEFSITPTVFSDIRVQRGAANRILWSDKSEVRAVCKNSAKNLYMRVTPIDGISDADASGRVGKTSRDGLGILYKLGTTVPQNLTECSSWNTDILHSTLVNDGSGVREGGGPIHWALYQYSETLVPGTFSATINYEFWVD